jgi:Tfp pilus assembly protein PilX
MVKHKQVEKGFVAIVVTMMIMIILSLITIGFTRIMQREQRQALDRQLSRQALYAAESGINDVYNKIKNAENLVEKTDCSLQDLGLEGDGVLNDARTVGYTCAMYDKTPKELVYSVGVSDSRIALLKTASGNNFNSLDISWGNEDGSALNANDSTKIPDCVADANSFTNDRAGTIPFLRLDITDISTLSRAGLIAGTDSLYIVPCKGPGPSTTYTYSTAAPKGKVIQVNCREASDARPCRFTIDGLNQNTYSMRLRSIYDSAAVVITAIEVSGAAAEFAQAQTSIDVTAKANDVTRRLRVSIPTAEATSPPEAVVQVFNGVCKKLSVIDEAGFNNDSVTEFECQ